jgi:hypothetical protein
MESQRKVATAPPIQGKPQAEAAAPQFEVLPAELDDAGEMQAVLRATSMQALVRMDGLTEQDVDRMIKARLRLIESTREMTLKVTKPEDWTLWKDNEGHVVGTPRASAMLTIRPWFNVRIYNHRSLDGLRGQPSSKVVKKSKDGKSEDVTVLEGLCDVQLGRDFPMEGIYFCLRSDDDFTGRVKRKDILGGPREQDLWASFRTGIDKKAIATVLGLTKVPEEDLKRAGLDTLRCYRGSGYGTSGDRTAGREAAPGVASIIDALRKSIIRRTHADMEAGKKLVKEITSRPPNPKKKGDKGYPGVDSLERLTLDWQVRNAIEKLKVHPIFGNAAMGWPEDAEDPPIKDKADAGAEPPEEEGDREPGAEG